LETAIRKSQKVKARKPEATEPDAKAETGQMPELRRARCQSHGPGPEPERARARKPRPCKVAGGAIRATIGLESMRQRGTRFCRGMQCPHMEYSSI